MLRRVGPKTRPSVLLHRERPRSCCKRHAGIGIEGLHIRRVSGGAKGATRVLERRPRLLEAMDSTMDRRSGTDVAKS